MKGIRFDLKLWKVGLKKVGFPAKFLMYKYKENWPEPDIQYKNQVIIKNSMSGICGSDIHQRDVDVTYVATILANKENPFPIGHEVVGEVITKGEEVNNIAIGDRVIYNPVATCEAYGFNMCSSCQKGNYASCYCLTGIGDGSKLEEKYGGRKNFGGYGGGGFSEYLIGFEHQFHKVPENVPDEVAVLTEPFSVAIHAVSRNLPKDNNKVIIIGAGIIGLLVIAAIRAYRSDSQIISLARYKHQAEQAKKFGADKVIIEPNRQKLYEKIAEITDGKLFKPTIGKKILFGNTGPDIIFDCVANQKTIDDSLHLVRCNGKIVVIGLGFNVTKTVDWAILPYKEITITGTMMHGLENYKGKKCDAFDIALEIFAENPDFYKNLVTNKFSLENYKEAFKTIEEKEKYQTIKTVFDF